MMKNSTAARRIELHKVFLAMCFLVGTGPGATAWAQDIKENGVTADAEIEHDALRLLRDGLIAAMNAGDIEQTLSYLHPNVVVTYQNAEIARGREGVRSYYNKMVLGENPVVASYAIKPAVDELTILYHGHTGISFGSAVEHFQLTNGKDFTLNSRWSATLVKENGQWLIASAHASTNLFDNPLLDIAKRMMYWAGAGGLAVGVVVGLLLRRRRKA